MATATILFVEDDRVQGQELKKVLEVMRYKVLWVTKGSEAIRTIKETDIDVVLLDLELPDISGNQVCRWIKLNEATKTTPVIILTARQTTADKVLGLHVGADDYLPKPVDKMELNARIYASLRTKSLHDELREKNRQLTDVLHKVEMLANTDSLTGLFNRRRFEAVVEYEFNRTRRYRSPLTCIMVDLDFFKVINEELGREAGDACLKVAAEVIKRNIREVDSAARWGSDEFVVLLNHTNKEEAEEPSRRILEQIEESEIPGFPDTNLTASAGIVTAPDPDIDSPDKLVIAADQAMYEAKKKGRSQIQMV